MINIEKLNTKYKCIFCTMLAEKAFKYITDLRGNLLVKYGITHCWEWLETGRYCGDDFYNAVIEDVYLTGFLYCAIAAEKASDKSTGAWYCIEETMMYIARKAYEKDGNRDFDEAIEEVQEECIEKAIEFLSETADVQDYTDEVYNLCLSETDLESIKQRFGLYPMHIDFVKLSDKYKCVFLLMLADKTLSCIESEDERDYSERALQVCWEWLDTGKHSGTALLDFVGDEEIGLYYYETTEEEPVVTAALNFVVTAVSFVSRIAFENEGVQDMPKFAAVTTDAIIPYVLDRFTMCYTNANQYISNVYKICLEEREFGYYYQLVKQFQVEFDRP